MAQHAISTARLSTVLKANVGFSLVSAAVLVVFSHALASLLFVDPSAVVAGVSLPGILWGIGLVLVPFAAFTYWAARNPAGNRWAVWEIVALDTAWVVGTVALLALAGSMFTVPGWIALIAVAIAVDAFAIQQFLGLRRLSGGSTELSRPATA